MRQKTLLSKLMLLLCAIMVGSSSVWAAEVKYKTLSFPDDNSSNNGLTSNQYQSTWTATSGSDSWTITNFNNNNWNNSWTYIKCGRKNTASVGTIITSAAIDEAITKVVVTVDAFTSGKVNSFKLYVASDANFTQNLQTITATIATGTNTFTVTTPTANSYYKVEIDCASGSGNGLVTVSKVEYYYNEGNPTCATPTFSPAAGVYTSAQNVTISCGTTGATIYYTTDGSTPTTSSSPYSSAIPVSSTTTIKAIAVATGHDNSSVASATYTILEHAGTQTDPYTVADSRAAIDANKGVTGVYATGIVSEIVEAYSSQHSNITFDIIDEGGSNTLRAYRCGGDDAADVQVGDEVVVSGNLTKYGDIYEFSSGCQLVSLTHPVNTNPSIEVSSASINVPAAMTEGTINVTYNNFTFDSQLTEIV